MKDLSQFYPLQELNYSRYKIVAQVLIGEQKGEGARMATRALWDTESDSYASHTFLSVSILTSEIYSSFLVK